MKKHYFLAGLLLSMPVFAWAWSAPALDLPSPRNLIIFTVAGMVGMLAHFYKKKMRGEIAGNLADYLVRDHADATLLMLLTFAGTAATMWLTGQLVMSDGALIALAFNSGWAIDSGVNKGAGA
ncbi:hypothetical protein [Parvibium lacunae]|uniref:Ammonium transporter n=1 Tax=Parvibium lacunae TaxID=1888893 RepID=A0A368L7N0_9BURK|nr:hypothetical protein [Parvibium lacunae]RCS59708.1 hypothetical protein DU000_03095 [Parvibium lacunae]